MVVPRSSSLLPTLDNYLARLPDGLHSFPDSRAKAHTLRSLIGDPIHPLSRESGLPPEIEELARKPPSADGWVPQVWLSAFHAVALDRVFSGAGGLAAFEEWSYQRNLGLLRPEIQRKGLDKAGPAALLAAQTAIWPSFYRGTVLRPVDARPGRAAFLLSYAPHLWPEVSRVALGASLRAAAVLAGATSATASAVEESNRTARLELRWT
jgi:hypothetical protein